MTNITSKFNTTAYENKIVELSPKINSLYYYTNTKKDEYKKFSFSFNNDLLEAIINTYVHRISSQYNNLLSYDK